MNETRYQMDLLKAMNQNLSARERMYRMICDMTDGAFLYLDACKNEIITVGKWAEFFDFEIREKRDLEKLYERIDEPYVIPLREVLLLDKSGKEDAKLDVKLKGSETWIRVQARAAYDKDGKLTDKVIGVTNVTEKTKQTQALDYYSYYDVITGLYNRNYFIRLLGELISKAQKEGTKVSVMMIDIDDFHKINDGMGMIYGDDMIKQLGSVLEALCNEKVFACHLNSDIFAMAIYDPKCKDTPAGVPEAITKRLSAPFYFSGDKSVRITVTIGVAEYPEAADHALDLMNCAEIV
ncbi:MAG: GGDEF domain-containing protein, partial [Lachnospiraceae bacterium]|nr:GGDEF domain-containing protein [Lachnospiraceae bacterium]